MQHDNVNYLVVGSFVLIVLAAFMAALALITGRTGPSDRYHTVYGNVAGIKFGTLVGYEGYPVGQVEAVTPLHAGGGTRYRVDFTVSRRSDGERWNIPVDSVARILSSGLLSAVTIDIQEGASATFHEPGVEILGIGDADLFVALADAATSIKELTADGIRPLVDSLGQSLNSVASEAERAVPRILAGLESVAERLNASAGQVDALLSEENRLRVESFIEHLDSSAARLEGLMSDDNRARVETFLGHLDRSLNRLDTLLDASTELIADNRPEIQRSVSDLRRSLQVVAQHIAEITFNLETASRNMNEFTRQIRQNPGLLLGSKAPRDAVGEAQ